MSLPSPRDGFLRSFRKQLGDRREKKQDISTQRAAETGACRTRAVNVLQQYGTNGDFRHKGRELPMATGIGQDC